MITLNEYMTFVRMAADGDVQPPFTDQEIDDAEYFNVYFSDEFQSYCLVLADAEGKEISKAYWEDTDFMQEYMSEYYGVDISDEDLDSDTDLISLNSRSIEPLDDDEFDEGEED